MAEPDAKRLVSAWVDRLVLPYQERTKTLVARVESEEQEKRAAESAARAARSVPELPLRNSAGSGAEESPPPIEIVQDTSLPTSTASTACSAPTGGNSSGS